MSLSSKTLSCAILLALSATASAADGNAADRAQHLIKGNSAAVRAAVGDAFVARDVIVDADGTEHVRFDRSYRGLAIIGGDVVVHGRGGQMKGASQTLKTSERPNLTPAVRSDEALVAAGALFGTHFVGVPTATLVIDARGAKPVLAYDVRFAGMNGQTPTDMHFIIDAKSGKVLGQWDMIHTAKPVRGTSCSTANAATGTGKTLFSGNVSLNTATCTSTSFQMKDQTRGGGYVTNMANGTSGSGTNFTDADNIWGNNTSSDTASAAADAHYSVAMTWDYFKNAHGRNGIANDGKGALSKVHYGRNYVNAYWSDACFCMTYGDGDGVSYAPLVTLDIAGHEMSHGVTSRSANLTYSGESGGLNEATSDIFGTMVEFSTGNANDPADYLVGEKIYLKYPAGNKALRYMYNPIADGQSPNCYTSTLGSLDVHYSSGVANRFFYLLAEGSAAKTFNGINHYAATCNGGSVNGIGRDDAGAIWYRALTVYMTSSTNYKGARTATLNAATDLFGASSAQYAAVADAWSAVSVN